MRALSLLSSLALAAAASGCYTMNASLPGTLRGDVQAQEQQPVGKLSIEKTNIFFLWGLAGKPADDFFAAEIRSQVQAQGGDGIAGLTYDAKHGVGSLLVGVVTLGFVVPRSYALSGDIVKIKKPSLEGASAAEPAAAAPASVY